MVLIDNQILEHETESAFRGADRDEQIDHPHDLVRAAEHKHTPARRFLKQEAQATPLPFAVGNEIALLRKKLKKELGQLREIVKSRGFYAEAFNHCRDV